MKAMIFAAGLGTRLYPLTADRPKALVKIAGQTLLEVNIKRLMSIGCSEIVINVHHFAHQIKEYLRLNHNFGAEIYISDESEILLDTGGGLKKAAEFLMGEEAFIVHNVDILSTIDLKELLYIHKQGRRKLATLAVNNRESSRVFLVDKNDALCGWKNKMNGETKISVKSEQLEPVSFCGIHIIDPEIFRLIKLDGIFSMVDLYLQLCMTNLIYCSNTGSAKWIDVGTIESLNEAEILFF